MRSGAESLCPSTLDAPLSPGTEGRTSGHGAEETLGTT